VKDHFYCTVPLNLEQAQVCTRLTVSPFIDLQHKFYACFCASLFFTYYGIVVSHRYTLFFPTLLSFFPRGKVFSHADAFLTPPPHPPSYTVIPPVHTWQDTNSMQLFLNSFLKCITYLAYKTYVTSILFLPLYYYYFSYNVIYHYLYSIYVFIILMRISHDTLIIICFKKSVLLCTFRNLFFNCLKKNQNLGRRECIFLASTLHSYFYPFRLRFCKNKNGSSQ
jgi:hypothetical protein